MDKSFHLSENADDKFYSHNFVVTYCMKAIDGEVMSWAVPCDMAGMANIQLIHPCCIISGQRVTAGGSQEACDKSLISREEDKANIVKEVRDLIRKKLQ